jgi:gamma-glutamylcyclotransferase (GGCT)/AIG2-like uncharacterized protein YtfP
MTDEEADALDERWTKTTPAFKQGVGGVFTRQRELLAALDTLSANYVLTRAEATHKTPGAVISEIIHKEVASTLN